MKKMFVCLLICSFSGSYSQTASLNILTSFHQGGATNCASISAIKLAIGRFGVDNVFKEVKNTEFGFHVRLRDDSEIDIKTSEIAQMKKLNFFVPGSDKEIFEYAQFLYAVMAKRKQKINNIRTIKRAATHRLFYHQLSMDTEENLHFLGLKNFVQKINKADVKNYDQIIITNAKHSVFGSNGIYDNFGTPASLNDFEKNHGNSPINTDDNYILQSLKG